MAALTHSPALSPSSSLRLTMADAVRQLPVNDFEPRIAWEDIGANLGRRGRIGDRNEKRGSEGSAGQVGHCGGVGKSPWLKAQRNSAALSPRGARMHFFQRGKTIICWANLLFFAFVPVWLENAECSLRKATTQQISTWNYKDKIPLCRKFGLCSSVTLFSASLLETSERLWIDNKELGHRVRQYSSS